MTRWLVTGGAGVIGSHLCEALLARGDTVRVLDDLSTGRRENVPPGTELIEGDVADPSITGSAVRDVAGCFHLAAIASVERGISDWLGAHRTNLTGAITLFDAIRGLPARIPVVYASSAAVYGDAATVPIAEDTACQPLSAYGADKHGCELHARVANHVHASPLSACASSTSMAHVRIRIRRIQASSPSFAGASYVARRSKFSATAARRVISCSSRTWSGRCSRPCACKRQAHPSSMSVPVFQLPC
jgi:GDP-D-mannose dehydratase